MFANSDNGGGTDWAQKSVPEMWSMLAAHDGTAHKELLLTWKRSADLLVDHLSRVKRYREDLAEAWPPEKSQASAKYLDRLDDLIKHLSETYHATVENHRALGVATSALVGARLKLEAIHREYVANQQDLDAYAIRQRSYQETVSKYRGPVSAPTAVASRQLDLQLQAQSLMSTLSTDLAQAQLNITTPDLYRPTKNLEGSQPLGTAGKGDDSTTPSALPPISGTRTTNSTSASGNLDPIGSKVSPIHDPVPPASQTPPPDPQASVPSLPGPAGPTLSGLGAPETEHDSSQATQANSSAKLASGLGGFSNLPVIGTTSPTPQPGVARVIAGAPAETNSQPFRGAQGTIPGGIIGGTPGTSSPRVGTSPRTTQRINPMGGIIGPQGSAGSSSVSNRAPKPLAGESDKDRWDPDDPWTTTEGVSPILLPPEKEEIYPGPAIGLP
ncbi:hypothetical protein [Actinoplanes regularis]|uniref:Uncharacterized protein n=1 Tax=Actinoplanes regularis TaxID=52697 RepID=A0A238VAH3_9ACTN|nr:hypothetical protein [Actinoplanes regularis]GIE83689.1 hypothetical protein Are01nite_01690 [Actinoplanes regularis]SNR31037.1 hypothetical protein SAMN06264365_101902 [Actinoplanes regularis]